jgi:hypothetical protein
MKMREQPMMNIATRLALLVLVLWVSAASAHAQRSSPAADNTLRDAILKEFGYAEPPKDFRYMSRSADLNGDGHREVFVWVPTLEFGGTSGYPLLLFARERGGYRLLLKYEPVWTPLVILNTSRFGWHDIAVQMGGGGEKMHYVIFRHTGRAYSDDFAPMKVGRVRGKWLMGQGWQPSVVGPLPR